jgi:hypothetical protein
MKLLPLLEVLVVNAFLIPLLVLITENYGLRNAYWGLEGFAPTTARYPLFFVTSAVKGTTSIPGLLTVDWQQIVLLILVVTDAVYALSLYRSLKAARSNPALSVPEQGATAL